MNIFDIIDYTRNEILDDTLEPFKWDNTQLLRHLNRAYEELCRETLCLVDSSTSAVCRINLLSYLATYSLHAKILKVHSMRRESDGAVLLPKTELYMDSFATNWRDVTGTPVFRIMDTQNKLITVYPKYDTEGFIEGSSDITFVASTHKITKAGATFTSHFGIGDSLVVTGTTLNNGTFTITNVAATEITVSEALVNETNTSATLRKVREVAVLRVSRLPITAWTLAQLEGSSPPSPETDETYHVGLSDGIAKWAFKKQDVETYDPNKAKEHFLAFEDFKSNVRYDLAALMEGDTVNVPHYGMI